MKTVTCGGGGAGLLMTGSCKALGCPLAFGEVARHQHRAICGAQRVPQLLLHLQPLQGSAWNPSSPMSQVLSFCSCREPRSAITVIGDTVCKHTLV